MAKFEVNVARDRRNRKTLRALGYRTFEIWECELEKGTRALKRVLTRLRSVHESGPGHGPRAGALGQRGDSA